MEKRKEKKYIYIYIYNTLLINPTIRTFSSLSLFPPNLEGNNMVGHEGKSVSSFSILHPNTLNIVAKMAKYPFCLKVPAKCLCSKTILRYVPFFKLDFLKIKFQCKTRFVENRVTSNQT